MTTFKNFGFAFALALGVAATGCADDPKAMGGDGGGGGGGGGGGSGSSTQGLDATGKYSVVSTYDIATNMPGTAGDVVNAFIAATDDPADPTQWVLDQLIAQMPNGTLKSVLKGAEPFVAGYLNDKVLDFAPDFVTTIKQVGDDFGQMAKKFGVNETYDIAKSGTDYMSTDTAVGIHFKIDNIETDLAFTDYQMQNVVVQGVGVKLDATGGLAIDSHKMPLSYGKILHLGLDNVVIPAISGGSASDLAGLLAQLINCDTVGQYIDDAMVQNFGFDLGNASTWSAACTAGLQFGANAIYQKINAIDAAALEFDVSGQAKCVDTNGDHKVDAIQTGKWAGNMVYGGTPAALSTATFTGTRQ
jgi:hypothetical protein